jgi:hypothetical protein
MNKLTQLIVMSLLSSSAMASATFTCQDIYIKTINHKEVVKEKVDRVNDSTGALMIVISTVNPIAGLTLLAGAIGSEIYANSPSKEEKLLRLANENTKVLRRFVKELKKDINPNIDENEVREIISEGIQSGHYCSKFPVLFDTKDAKRHVRTMLNIKYH